MADGPAYPKVCRPVAVRAYVRSLLDGGLCRLGALTASTATTTTAALTALATLVGGVVRLG